MKIHSVDCLGLFGKSPKGGWSNEIQPDDSVHALVIIKTDEGHVGIGSVFTDARLVEAALGVLRPLLIGESIEPMRVSEKLHQNTFWMGRGGSLTHAISGIDIALWDIFGKVTGQPIGRLLGGRYRDKVKAYASILMEMPDLMRERTALYRAQGFRAIKIGWGPFGRRGSTKLDEDIVRAAREGAGDDCLLMVDAGASDAFWPNGLNWAVNAAQMLKDYDVRWFEEALVPDAMEDFKQLRQRSPVPIATGECITRRQNYLPWFENRALDIVQPDVTKVGGISEQIQIARMANEFGIQYIGHGWNTAVGLAADLQLAAAIPTAELVEYIGGSPYVDDITEGGWKLDQDGMLAIPDAPGLGISLDRAAVHELTRNADAILG
ncbi:mandelate racemase/muconate lactonizing enzyme family protein [Aestuariivirga sp. YIM B02566]|uniref:Mandelate racemase/muconate lactonizing enzyme family protein n=1 Tax=Taklimakanibacter albus TaxID=2800327 RepID=A0ACC5RAP1_9HYPH|nr:mandelate racemase/muconate lactonizing enzyme family protein [Aestuariivirga sp. YIM B02566]MBK1869707.1 mandelate racemase/muconate lactonizing enzyme family protein [Aestuariivirga sp. YIM B02566]